MQYLYSRWRTLWFLLNSGGKHLSRLIYLVNFQIFLRCLNIVDLVTSMKWYIYLTFWRGVYRRIFSDINCQLQIDVIYHFHIQASQLHWGNSETRNVLSTPNCISHICTLYLGRSLEVLWPNILPIEKNVNRSLLFFMFNMHLI